MEKNGIIGNISTGFPFVFMNSGVPLLCQFECEIIDLRENEDRIDIKCRIFKIRILDPVCAVLQIAHREIFDTKDTGMMIIPVEIDVDVQESKSCAIANLISKDDYAAKVYDLFEVTFANSEPHSRAKQHKLLKQALPKSHHILYYKVEEYLAKNWTEKHRTDQWEIEDLEDMPHSPTNEEVSIMTSNQYAPPVKTQYLS